MIVSRWREPLSLEVDGSCNGVATVRCRVRHILRLLHQDVLKRLSSIVATRCVTRLSVMAVKVLRVRCRTISVRKMAVIYLDSMASSLWC